MYLKQQLGSVAHHAFLLGRLESAGKRLEAVGHLLALKQLLHTSVRPNIAIKGDNILLSPYLESDLDSVTVLSSKSFDVISKQEDLLSHIVPRHPELV